MCARVCVYIRVNECVRISAYVPFFALKLEIKLLLLAEAFSPERLCSVVQRERKGTDGEAGLR